MKRTPLERRVALHRLGVRGKEWDAERRELKSKFERAGIRYCELRYNCCMMGIMLGYAHSHKRRNIPRGSPLLGEVILACTPCHVRLEAMGESLMKETVRGVIAGREEKI